MPSVRRLNKKLAARFGGAVRAAYENGVVTLTGEAPSWAEVVEAGRLCAARGKYTLVNEVRCPAEPQPPMKLPAVRDELLEGRSFDVAVIGGGVVGCAVARELTRWKLRVALIEKEHDVAMQASSRNDGMVHPGIDLRRGTLKQRYNARGNAMYDAVCAELGVPFRRTGQILCLRQKWARYLVPLTPLYWRSMGVPCESLSRAQVLEREPGLSGEVQ